MFFSSLAQAVSASQPGDEIQITGSLDIHEPIRTTHPLRFLGFEGRPTLTFRGLAENGTGMLTTQADCGVSNLEFRDARSVTGNCAGIWHLSGALTVANCTFRQNQNGIMIAAGDEDTASISQCSFLENGAGCGHTHGIYASRIGSITVEHSSFENTLVGHHFKSRARTSKVIGNYFGGKPNSTTSYCIDIADGGLVCIANNLFIKGHGAMSRKFIAYGAEHRRRTVPNGLLVRNNIFISHRRWIAFAVVNFMGRTPARLVGNAFEGRIVPLTGRGATRLGRHAPSAIAAGATSID